MQKVIPWTVAGAVVFAVAGVFPAAAQNEPQATVSESSAPSPDTGSTSGDEGDNDLTQGTNLKLSAEGGFDYTDNYFSNRDRKISAWGVVVKPAVQFDFAVPRFKFGVGVSGEYGNYNLENNTNDTYTDGTVSFGAAWLSAARHRFSFGTDLVWNHDPFGTARTEGTPGRDSDLDRYRREALDVKYFYGLPSSPFNVELRLGTQDKEYTTNRAFTRFLNYQAEGAGATVFYNFSPKTALLFDTQGRRTRYDDVEVGGPFDRSSNELRYRVGARWLATAKTTGDVRVGLVQRTYPNHNFNDLTKVDWQAAVAWTPRSYTQFTFQTGRQTQESYIPTVSFINNQFANVEWSYDWTALFTTRASLGYTNADFVGSDRTDKVASLGFGADYRLTPYLALFGSANYNQRKSNNDVREFDRYNVYAGVRFVR